MTILVLAIGNILLSDDGIGIHVLNKLRGDFCSADSVKLCDGGTLSFTLVGAIADATALIVIDAAQLGSVPGTIQTFLGTNMDNFLAGQRHLSAHELSIMDLMAMAQLTGDWPERRALIAIQPEKIDWGESPTALVNAAIPAACNRIKSLINHWRNAQ